MKKWFPVFLAAFLFCSYVIEDCAKVHNGKFYYFTKKDRTKVIVTRTDTIQIEVEAKEGGEYLRNRVEWKKDCVFDMYINALSDKKLTGIDSIIAATPAKTKIIYIGSSYYVGITTMNIFNKKLEYRDTLYYY